MRSILNILLIAIFVLLSACATQTTYLSPGAKISINDEPDIRQTSHHIILWLIDLDNDISAEEIEKACPKGVKAVQSEFDFLDTIGNAFYGWAWATRSQYIYCK